jgi:V/A-type H+-transporting ATPase subunit K
MNRKTSIYVLASLMAIVILALPQASAADGDDNEQTVKAAEETSKGYMAIGAGLAIGLAGIGTGVAQSHTGAAAVGAVAEDRSNFANSLIFIAIPETVVILGFVIANQILG